MVPALCCTSARSVQAPFFRLTWHGSGSQLYIGFCILYCNCVAFSLFFIHCSLQAVWWSSGKWYVGLLTEIGTDAAYAFVPSQAMIPEVRNSAKRAVLSFFCSFPFPFILFFSPVLNVVAHLCHLCHYHCRPGRQLDLVHLGWEQVVGRHKHQVHWHRKSQASCWRRKLAQVDG